MGTIISPDQKIDKLFFHKMPSRPIKVEKAIRVGNTIICVGSNGTLYTDSKLAGNFAYSLGVWPWLDDVFQALVKLGILEKSQVDAHMQAAQKAEDNRSRRCAIADMDKIEKKYNVKFTAKQRKIVSGQ